MTTTYRTRSTCESCWPTSARRSCATLGDVLERLGHEVTPFAVSVSDAIELIAREDPDLAFVVFDGDDAHGLALISETVEFASGPVLVTMREVESARTIAQAADMGIAGYVDSWAPDDVQGAIEVAMARHRDEKRLIEKVVPARVRARAAGGDRARQGDPDGAPLGRRPARVRAAARPLALGRAARRRRGAERARRARSAAQPVKSVARQARQPRLTSRRRTSGRRARRSWRRRPPR